MENTQLKVENGTTTIKATCNIDATPSKVWETLEKPGDIKKFHPLIKESFMLSQRESGVGAKRHCDLKPMGAMDELITEWSDGISFKTKLIGGKMLPPLSFMEGEVELENVNTQTQVSFTISYKLKYGIAGRIMDTIMVRPQFKGAPMKYVRGLKNYIEDRS